MPGILDYLTGNSGAASPWGMLYPSPLLDPLAQMLQNKGQAPAAPDAAAYGALGVDPSAMMQPTAPVSPFQQQQQPAAPPNPANGPFGDPSKISMGGGAPQGASPFGFAGPGSMSGINPANFAPPVPAAAPQVAAGPSTDLSSVNRPAPVANDPIDVGNNYQMPRIGGGFPADDGEEDTPVNARPAQGVAPGAPQSQAAPFSLAGAGAGAGDRLMKATRGFMGNMGSGPIGALMGGLGALVTGQSTDPTSIASEQYNATGQALLKKGASLPEVQAARYNPVLQKALIDQYYGKDKYALVKTADGMGVERPIGAFNQADGTMKRFAGADAPDASAAGIGDMTKKGSEYLATVPPRERNTIEMMIRGDLPPPTSFALAKPYWQNMIAAARNVDPNFTETGWAPRVSMRRSAEGDGKMGQNNNAIVTGIGHLMQLNDAIPALNNSENSQTYNRVSNAISTEFGGTGATNFAAVANRVAPEIVKIWRGTGGAEADIKRDIESLNTSQTPAQLHGAIANIAGMMRSKLESNQQEYKATMGRDLPLTAEQQKTLSLLDRMAAGTGGPAAPAAGSAPVAAGTVNVGGKPIAWKVN